MASKGWCNGSSRSNGITTINICKSSNSSSYPPNEGITKKMNFFLLFYYFVF